MKKTGQKNPHQNKKLKLVTIRETDGVTHFVAFDCDFFASSLSFSFLAFFISRGIMSSNGEWSTWKRQKTFTPVFKSQMLNTEKLSSK